MIALTCILLLLVTTVVHYEVLRLLARRLPTLAIPARARLIVVILGTFFAHFIEISLYAGAIYLLVHMTDTALLRGSTHPSLAECLYFSSETYSSLGYGDVAPTGSLRLLAGMEVLNGLLLIGWSASYTYIAMERFWKDD